MTYSIAAAPEAANAGPELIKHDFRPHVMNPTTWQAPLNLPMIFCCFAIALAPIALG